MTHPDRRFVIAGLAATLALPAAAAAAPADPIAAIERRHGGRLGVFALDTGSGAMLAHRADEHVLLCSTMKSALAAAVLARVDAGTERLDARVRFVAADLPPNSPVTQAHVGSGALSVGELCQAILAVSDNGAANLLLARIGGPAALTAFARRCGDRVTRFDRTEPVLNRADGMQDTTTPRAIAGLLRTLLLGDVLRADSRARLERWMAANTRGPMRLRGGMPPDWRVADRTGTTDGQCNDIAIVRPPARAPLLVAAYYAGNGMTMEAQEVALREVGAAVAAWADAHATGRSR